MTSSEAIRLEREEGDGPLESQIAARFAKIEQSLKEKPHEPLLSNSDKIQQLTKDSQLPKLHADRKVLTGEEWQKVFAKIKGELGIGFIFALVGLRGAGKTQLGCSIIKENITRQKSSRFATAMDIFLDLKASFRKEATTTEKMIVDEYCKPRLLVIDEIQERAESPWEDRILTHLINRRYNDEKDTLLIGNLTRDAFTSTMGASIVSRLNETGGIIECNWESFRK